MTDNQVDRIRSLDRGEILKLWSRIKQGHSELTEEWGAGRAFELLVVRAFELEGISVRWPYRVTYPQRFGTMEQIDGALTLDGNSYILESKHLSEAAAIEAIAKLRFRLEGRPPGTMGLLFSVNNFTVPTEVFAQFASPLNVLLWSRSDLDVALPAGGMAEGLRAKYRFAVEEGLPHLSLGGHA